MQKYHSIADVAIELQNVLDKKTENVGGAEGVKISEEAMEVCLEGKKEKGTDEEVMKSNGNVDGDEVVVEEEDSPDSDITDSGKRFSILKFCLISKGFFFFFLTFLCDWEVPLVK